VEDKRHNDEKKKKKKKKNKKRRLSEEHEVTLAQDEAAGAEQGKTYTTDLDDAALVPVNTLEEAHATKKKKKDKKKHKRKNHHRSPDTEVVAQIEPEMNQAQGDAEASNNAFISAVMTAAAGCNSQEPVHHDFSSFAPMIRPPTPPLGFLAIDPSLSGEELARMLNVVDVAKIADALRALGPQQSDAFPLPGQPTLPSPSNRHFARKNGTSQPSKSRGLSHRKAQNITFPDPLPAQSEHAHILSHRWLNATKLNNLAKEIGMPIVWVVCGGAYLLA
jgi:hypothetical protein